MTTLKALGYFMDYCNNHMNDQRVTNDSFQAGMREILNSPDERFLCCRTAADVLRELGW